MTLLKAANYKYLLERSSHDWRAGNEWKFSELAKIQIRFRFSGVPRDLIQSSRLITFWTSNETNYEIKFTPTTYAPL